MDSIPLGNSDIRVSRLGLGTMTFGNQTDEAEAVAIMDLAFEAGVTLYDTAEIYPIPPDGATQGRTEEIVGRWIKARGNRDRVVLTGKVAGPGRGMDYLRPEGWTLGLDRRNIEYALEQSLRRLGVDHLDLYFVHWPARRTSNFGRSGYMPTTPEPEAAERLEEVLGLLGELRQAGKIRTIGLSNETPWGVMRAMEAHRRAGVPAISAVQNPQSLVNRTAELGLGEVLHREGVTLFAHSPLAMGLLTGKFAGGARPADARLVRFDRYPRYLTPMGLRAAERYAALAMARGLDPACMALAFLMGRPTATVPLVGARTAAQLRQTLPSVSLRLDDDTLAAIDVVHVDSPNPCP